MQGLKTIGPVRAEQQGRQWIFQGLLQEFRRAVFAVLIIDAFANRVFEFGFLQVHHKSAAAMEVERLIGTGNQNRTLLRDADDHLRMWPAVRAGSLCSPELVHFKREGRINTERFRYSVIRREGFLDSGLKPGALISRALEKFVTIFDIDAIVGEFL